MLVRVRSNSALYERIEGYSELCETQVVQHAESQANLLGGITGRACGLRVGHPPHSGKNHPARRMAAAGGITAALPLAAVRSV